MMEPNNLTYLPEIVSGSAHSNLYDDHLQVMHRAWLAYNGQLSKPLRVRSGRVDDNVLANFCRTIVDTSVGYLFGEDVTFSVDESRERNELEKWWDEVWEYNKKGVLLQRLATNGAICGHAFLKIRIDERHPYPRLVVIDPVNVTVHSAPDDYEDVIKYVIQWNGLDTTTDPKKQIAMVYRQTIEYNYESGTWVITDERTRSDRATLMTGWELLAQEEWPFPWPPIIDCQNLPSANEFWGMADLEPDVVMLQEALNRSISNLNRILRIYAHPKMYTKGLNEAQQRQISIDADGMIHLPGQQGEINVLQTTPDLRASIEFYIKLREAIHQLSRTPEITTGKVDNIGPLAGVALRILYGPLLQKTLQKQLTYGYLLKEINRRLAEIGGFGDNNIPILTWPEIVPSDPVAEGQSLMLDKQFGASDYTLLEKRGYDPEKEAERSSKEAEEGVRRQQMAMATATESDSDEDSDMPFRGDADEEDENEQ